MRAERASVGRLAVALLLSGCAGSASQVRPPLDQSPGSLYPLATGYAWSYDVDAGDGAPVLAIARVVGLEGGVAVVVTGAGSEQRYAVGPEGIRRVGQDGFLLKAPIAAGASWQASAGVSARVASLDERVTTEAGTFEHCVLVEEQNTESGQHVLTTYCPGVGPALVISEMEVRGQKLRVTARLRGYSLEAAPVE
jgi:hypothetical protein